MDGQGPAEKGAGRDPGSTHERGTAQRSNTVHERRGGSPLKFESVCRSLDRTGIFLHSCLDPDAAPRARPPQVC